MRPDELNSVSYRASKLRKIRFIWHVSGEIARRERVPRVRQFAELILLRLLRQLGPLVYYEQALWNPALTLREKRRCMNGRQYEQRVRELNPPAYHCLANHKVVEAALLRQSGIPTAEYLGFLHATDGTDATGKPLTNLQQLKEALHAMAPVKLCFKPVEGMQGTGFAAAAFDLEHGELLARDAAEPGLRCSPDEFLQRRIEAGLANGFIMQRFIEQHPAMAAFNPESVNTLRVWVLQCGREVHVRGALLRMGRAGSVIDNSSRGGLLAPIDLQTGCLQRVKLAAVFPELLAKHPDSGVQVEGEILPFWQECKQLARDALRALPALRFSGLDIAITESGPIIVETNPLPDRKSARNFGAPMADLLDCGCCKSSDG